MENSRKRVTYLLHTYELAYQTATTLNLTVLIVFFNDDYDHEVMTMIAASRRFISSPSPRIETAATMAMY